jgi:hypothetical protein
MCVPHFTPEMAALASSFLLLCQTPDILFFRHQ